MKKSICFIYCAFATAACYGQLGCKKSTPVDKIVVFTELPENGKLAKHISLSVNGDSVDVKLDPTENGYLVELDTKKALTKNDVKLPYIRNYAPDPEQPVYFMVQKDKGACRAEYSFSYLAIGENSKYKLEIVYTYERPPVGFAIDGKPLSDKPIVMIMDASKGYVEVKAEYSATTGWTYYFMYVIKDNENKLGLPLIHSTDTIIKRIIEYPDKPITDAIPQQYIHDYFHRNKQVIKYTLTKIE